MTRLRTLIQTAAMVSLALSPEAVRAQTYLVENITSSSIGTVAAATTGTTVFRNASGAISVVSGNGAVVGGSATAQLVSIRCFDQILFLQFCGDSSNKARIRVGRTGTPTGRAHNLAEIGVYSGTGTIGSGTNETTGTVDVTLAGWTGGNQLRTFWIYYNFPISGDDTGGLTGLATSFFYVYATANPSVPTSGQIGSVTATVKKSLSIGKVSDLRFGSMFKPSSGSYVATISGVTGALSASPTSAAGNLLTSATGAATYTIAGEPNATFSLSYPSTMTMTAGGSSLTATLSSATTTGTKTMPVTGTMPLVIGGSITVGSAQAYGAYSGSFSVTVAYN